MQGGQLDQNVTIPTIPGIQVFSAFAFLLVVFVDVFFFFFFYKYETKAEQPLSFPNMACLGLSKFGSLASGRCYVRKPQLGVGT
jgi:hypothetical protein